MLNVGQKLGNEGNENMSVRIVVVVNHVSYAATIWVNTVLFFFFF